MRILPHFGHCCLSILLLSLPPTPILLTLPQNEEINNNMTSNLRKVRGERNTATVDKEDRPLKSKSKKKSWSPHGEDTARFFYTSNASSYFMYVWKIIVAICYKHKGKTHYHNKVCTNLMMTYFGKVPGVHTYKDNHPLI